MIRLCRHNRRGITLVEVMVAMGITALMVISTMAMLLQTSRRCETEVTQTGTDTDATLAMQMIVNDVREAKRVTPLADFTQLQIIKPVRTADGYYDRTKGEDTLHPIYYYISDSSHVMGRTGTWLWRSEVQDDHTDYRWIRRDMDPNGLIFNQPLPKEVEVTLRIKAAVSHGASGLHRKNGKNLERDGLTTELTDRVVYLRNY